ncbi:MAG TPA: metal ABC transporter ATP-binding protein [Candidatus Hydrogenedentes bacterium]|jgi:ABC-type Mn2+/Zn2+ transport system ATPase subunit|nr:metal ABC transporter ATP-binding protein [Candidatus Hydrogenedentota bacterium]HPK00493.1 metal ABC transporter ATP-binding protein [Candidatus Hydrogenedentota bacterium]
MQPDAIVLENVSVTAHHATILHNLSLRVAHGSFVGVLGPNGAGKTTLLNVINGLIRPSSGEVTVLGKKPFQWEGHRLRSEIGRVAQAEPVDRRLPITVRETVLVARYGRLGWLRRPGPGDHARVNEALAAVGMESFATRPLGHLSGGEYQRVAIARALAQDPRLFLFDEPTASIDPRVQSEIVALVEEIHAARGVTSLYVTHDLATLPKTCETVILLREGRIWASGPREAMLEEARLAALYARNSATGTPA